MKKIILSTIIMGISMAFIGCSNLQNSSFNTSNGRKITLDEAKDIALKHANLTSEQVSFIKAGSEVDDGIEKYNIEFYYENKEYDYEINAADGQIIEFDNEVENYNITNEEASGSVNEVVNGNGNTNADSNVNENTNENTNVKISSEFNGKSNSSVGGITLEEAKTIALNHANLANKNVTFGRSEVDYDNGIKKYEIEFYYGNKEYDYEINAANGQILNYDYDTEYNNNGGNSNAGNGGNSNNGVVKISVEKAKEIAITHSNLKSNQVIFAKAELDYDDGIQKYEIEFYYNNREYSYDIDANSGAILSYEQD